MFFMKLRVRQSFAFAAGLFLLLIVLDELESLGDPVYEKAVNNLPFSTVSIMAKPASDIPKLQRLGTVEPIKLSNLTSQVSGRVLRVSPHFKKGKLINAGQQLLTIDPLPYKVVVSEAESIVVENEIALHDAKIRYSENSLNISLARSRLKAAKINLKQAKSQLKNTVISLPFAGEITEIETYLGEYISVGSHVAKILPRKSKQILVPIGEREFSKLLLPTDVNLIEVFSSDKKNKWNAEVIGVSQHTENMQRTVYLKVLDVDDSSFTEELLYGQHIYAEFPLKVPESTFQLPESALTLKGEVWWINSSNELIKKKLEDYILFENKVYFQLYDKELVNAVLFPSALLSQGMLVTPTQFKSL